MGDRWRRLGYEILLNNFILSWNHSLTDALFCAQVFSQVRYSSKSDVRRWRKATVPPWQPRETDRRRRWTRQVLLLHVGKCYHRQLTGGPSRTSTAADEYFWNWVIFTRLNTRALYSLIPEVLEYKLYGLYCSRRPGSGTSRKHKQRYRLTALNQESLEHRFLYMVCRPWEWLWIIFKLIELETRHPVDGYFSNEFPSIWNHCGVMAAWSRKTMKKNHFCVFWNKRPVAGKFSKFCSDSFHRLTDWRIMFKFREIWPTGNR